MAAGMRSLASFLWDDGDATSLAREWKDQCELYPRASIRLATTDFSESQGELEKERSKRRKLQEENFELHNMIKILQKQQLPKVAAVVSRAQVSSCRGPPEEQTSAWLGVLPTTLLELPRMRAEILPELESTGYCKGCIVVRLVKSQLASSVLSHAESVVKGLSCRHPAVFKIGVTSNPVRRWQHSRYGYLVDKCDSWQGLIVVHVAASAQAVSFLEASLIRLFLETPGCRNIRLGGEGLEQEGSGPFFCYVAYRILFPPKRL